ncbi:MAG: septum formation initiator family protein [Terracidiphilus sp.]
MADGKMQAGTSAAGTVASPMPRRALDWTMRVWRPAGTVLAVALALLLTWHVINGKNGLNAWHDKRAEDHRLQREIKDLEQENARLRERIQRLTSDPEAVGMLAREKLHYVKSNEVIATLPPQEKTPAQPAPAGK